MTNTIISLTKTKPIVVGHYLVLDTQGVVYHAIVGEWPKGINLTSGTGYVAMDGPEDNQRVLEGIKREKVEGIPLELVAVFQKYSRVRVKGGVVITHAVNQLLLDGHTFYKIDFEAVDGGIKLEPVTEETATTGFHLLFINGLFEYVEAYKREGREGLSYIKPWYETKQYAIEDTIAQTMRFGGSFTKYQSWKSRQQNRPYQK